MGWIQLRTGMLVPLLVCLLLTTQSEASCRGSCGACSRRYGCMTPAWGKCCTQFFMHNGRKRSMLEKPTAQQDVMESLIEFVRLKSKRVNRPSMDEPLTSSLKLERFLHPGISQDADESLSSGGNTGWRAAHTTSLDPETLFAGYVDKEGML